jgi:hypothetical protein
MLTINPARGPTNVFVRESALELGNKRDALSSEGIRRLKTVVINGPTTPSMNSIKTTINTAE